MKQTSHKNLKAVDKRLPDKPGIIYSFTDFYEWQSFCRQHPKSLTNQNKLWVIIPATED